MQSQLPFGPSNAAKHAKERGAAVEDLDVLATAELANTPSSAAKPVESEGGCPASVATRGRKRVAAEMLTSSSTYPTTESVSKRSAAGLLDENDSDRLTLPEVRSRRERKSSEAGIAEFL